MEKVAETQYPVHELIAHRWSPRAFTDMPVEEEKLLSVLEAARWAASCFNAQPWRFIVATKEKPEQYERLLGTLLEFNQNWVKLAPVIIISVAQREFGHNGKPNAHAWHDVGQAAANMAIQATALGLQIHQMAGFSADKVREEFQIPAEFEAVAAIALGYPGEPEILPADLQDRERAPRLRHPLTRFVFTEAWEHPLTNQVPTV